MKIGVISDTHGDLEGWRKALAGPFKSVNLILHAGDILYHGPRNPLVAGYNPATLAEAINSSPVPVIFTRGNCDSPVDQLVIEYPIQAPYAFLQIDNTRIMLQHGDELSRERMVEQAKTHHVNICIFGHTHTPALEVKEGVLVMNPGSPALPKMGRPVVGLIDTKERKAFLVDLDSGEILQQARFQSE